MAYFYGPRRPPPRPRESEAPGAGSAALQMLSEEPDLRDKVALRLLLDYGLRKGRSAASSSATSIITARL